MNIYVVSAEIETAAYYGHVSVTPMLQYRYFVSLVEGEAFVSALNETNAKLKSPPVIRYILEEVKPHE